MPNATIVLSVISASTADVPQPTGPAVKKARFSILVSPRLAGDPNWKNYPFFADWPKRVLADGQGLAELLFGIQFLGSSGSPINGPVLNTIKPPIDMGAVANATNLYRDQLETKVVKDYVSGEILAKYGTTLSTIGFEGKTIKEWRRETTSLLKQDVPPTPPGAPNSPNASAETFQGQLDMRQPFPGWKTEDLARELQKATDPETVKRLRDLYHLHRFDPQSWEHEIPAAQPLMKPISAEIAKYSIISDALEQGPPTEPQPLQDVHEVIATLQYYFDLARALGLIIDLECDFSALGSLPASMKLRPTVHRQDQQPLQQLNVRTCLTNVSYSTTPPLLAIAPKAADGPYLNGFFDASLCTVHEEDPFSEAARTFSATVEAGESPAGAVRKQLENPPTMAVRVSLKNATSVFHLSTVRNQELERSLAATAVQEPEIFLEDTVRGVRPDVRYSKVDETHVLTAKWSPLCRVRTQYNGTYVNQDTERWTEFGVQRGGDLLVLTRSHLDWYGYSLGAQLNAKAAPDTVLADNPTPPTTQNPDFATFSALVGTLPPLRFGWWYQFRFRLADIAGNGLPPAAIGGNETTPYRFSRGQAVHPPLLVPESTLAPGTDPGETEDTVVIRSFWKQDQRKLEWDGKKGIRTIAPPPVELDTAKMHGIIDPGNPLRVWTEGTDWGAIYDKLAACDCRPDRRVVNGAANYYPDPSSNGWMLQSNDPSIGFQSGSSDISQNWPALRVAKLVLSDDSTPGPITTAGQPTGLAFALPKGSKREFIMWSTVKPDLLTSFSIAQLEFYRTQLEVLLRTFYHPQLNPPRTVTLVHAVQVPLKSPAFVVGALPVRKKDSGVVGFSATKCIDAPGQTADQLIIKMRWTEVIDNGKGEVRRVEHTPTSTLLLPASDGAIEFTHDTGNMKHHVVEYRPIARSRFKSFFSFEGEKYLTPESEIQPVIFNIPSAIAPPPIDIAYITPGFGFGVTSDGGHSRKASVRVYLHRPWFVTGANELLGVGKSSIGRDLTFASTGAQLHTLGPANLPNGVVVFAQQGSDPIVGHELGFDSELDLWFADIAVAGLDSYFPFVQLNLYRLQVNGEPGLQLSSPVKAHFAQIAPERTLTIAATPTTLQFTVHPMGVTASGNQLLVTAHLNSSQPPAEPELWPDLTQRYEDRKLAVQFTGGNWVVDTLHVSDTERGYVVFEEFELERTATSPGRVVYSYILPIRS